MYFPEETLRSHAAGRQAGQPADSADGEHRQACGARFGGKYRIIDFPLSNCVNSGIDTVGILTQYQPLELNEYIGNGLPWGLNKSHCCARCCLPTSGTTRKAAGTKGHGERHLSEPGLHRPV